MSMRVRCPVCGMQVKLDRVYPRPVVAVDVGSKGRARIFHKIIDPTPPFVLKMVKDVLETACQHISLYDFDKESLPSLIQESYLSLEPYYVYQPILIERR